MGAGPAGGNGGGGSPNQMAKDKAEKDRIENAKSRDKFGYTKTKKNKTKTKNQQNLEDAEKMQRENRGGNQPTVKVAETPKVDTSPTESELSQSSATDADEYDLRKVKKRGRSMMALTGPRGLLKDDKLTLSKPSLLGS